MAGISETSSQEDHLEREIQTQQKNPEVCWQGKRKSALFLYLTIVYFRLWM